MPTGVYPHIGRPCSEERRRKLSETRKRLGLTFPSFKGRHHTQKSKLKMRKAGLGKKGILSNSFRHGLAKSPFWNRWYAMRQRCQDKQNKEYFRYGGRGITVCKRWEKFTSFQKDMYQSYLEHCKNFGNKDTSLDRKDNNGNYNKKNCRWVTLNQQANNKRNNIFLTFKNKTLSVSQWAKLKKIDPRLFFGRLKRGWSVEKILT